MEHIIFYREWFPLPKGEFRIMAMLADKGQFRGNLSDLCRYFCVNPLTRNRNKLREAINALVKQGFIKCQQERNTYTMTAIPKGKKIEIAREHYESIRTRRRASDGESVSWEAVLKVYLWVWENDYDHLITNQMIQEDLNLSAGVICAAKNVLDREFEAIRRQKVSHLTPQGEIHTTGQNIGASAFWNSG